LEVRCNELLIASPSIHGDGNPWTVLPEGTEEIAILSDIDLLKLEARIDLLSQGYMSDENKQRYIAWLENPNTVIGEGSRHDAVKILGCSYYYRYNGWKDLTDDQRHDKLQEWNQQHCSPQLPDSEFNEIWKWIVKTHRTTRDAEHEKLRDAQTASLSSSLSTEKQESLDMPGCLSYQISITPSIWITGTLDNKLIEIERRTKKLDKDSNLMTTFLVTKKTFTACRSVRIIKHKNPLSFLELQPRYTIQFKGSEPSGNFTIKQKTIAEIVAELKNGNALCDNGIDVAITAQIKGFEKAGLLEVNDDMSYTGFFTNDNSSQIIPSGIQIPAVVDTQKLRDALEYINELARVGYQNRLDLLAHLILFGLIAPCSFIFKVIRAPTLEWLDFYGKPNAGKTSSGRIVLAVDGHERDDDYNVNMAHVDTTARFGDTVSVTTFPKLVDEMDFTDNKILVNLVKSAVDQPRLRKVLDRSRRSEYIPALSAFIMTSNPPPPVSDGALMKRLAARYFADKETHLKDSQTAKDFDALLSQLARLHPLGSFRNKFVMDNQRLVLDKKLTPFEKAKKIAIAAYESAQMLVPCWLVRKQLEQKHLEESIEDAKEAVRCAFENMIIDKLKTLKGINDLTAYPQSSLRFYTLVSNNMLPFARRIKEQGTGHKYTEFIAIDTGILGELYEYGITKEQLSNLKALADYIGASWKRTNGKTIIEVSNKQLEDYFGDEIIPSTRSAVSGWK